MINQDLRVSVKRQCELLKVNRSSYYYQAVPVSDNNLVVMKLIDELYLKRPTLGSRSMIDRLKDKGHEVNRKRVQRLMRLMGIEAIYPRPKTFIGNKVYPYLLKDVKIERVNQVWVTDITYIPMHRGYCYLIAIMDLYSRKILSWRLSNTMDTRFCTAALKEALSKYPKPDISLMQNVPFMLLVCIECFMSFLRMIWLRVRKANILKPNLLPVLSLFQARYFS